MTRSPAQIDAALSLVSEGWSDTRIAAELGIPRRTIGEWRTGKIPTADRAGDMAACPDRCPHRSGLDVAAYAYLLGLYLGDGTVSRHRRDVWRMRIVCCDWYPHLMDLCEVAIRTVMPSNVVGRTQREGCVEIGSSSKHWPCLFPQVGPGPKHTRKIELAPWQLAITRAHPRELVRGLVHSDGCRIDNYAVRNGTRSALYGRYFFSNVSSDILGIYTDALDQLGIDWRQNRWNSISVAKRGAVAAMDEFIGPKR